MTLMKAKQIINEAIDRLYPVAEFSVEHPIDERMGDFATNAAMVMAKKEGKNPRALAEEMAEKLKGVKELMVLVEKIEVAGPGFVNFFLRDEYMAEEVEKINAEKDDYGRGESWQGQKVIIEFTDPNPFKQFHIGHLMSNAIGESLARLVEFAGGQVKRACYQGDVGMHVAKSIWGLKELLKEKNQTMDEVGNSDLDERIAFLGRAYAMGATAFSEDEKVKDEINGLNKIIYERSNEGINDIYDLGKKWSLEYFEEIYRKLGTKFDYYFFESDAGEGGLKVVKENIDNGVFEESEGAVVFKGEKHGLHTRVFINSLGLPTYEAKELGLAQAKYDIFPYDRSVVVTGNEINAYFKVLLKVMSFVYPELAAKTTHIGHGMLRLKYGKMSSRTGNVVTGDSLIGEVGEEIKKKMEETGKIKEVERVDVVVDVVAVGAIKFSMLKQSPGKDIAFDFETSLSFEGDSGPYLQYAYARAMSVLAKGKKEFGGKIEAGGLAMEERELLKWLYRFSEVADLSVRDMAPNFICSYLIELASRFNRFYTECKIVGNEREGDRLALTAAVAQVLKNGLGLLGIDTVEKM